MDLLTYLHLQMRLEGKVPVDDQLMKQVEAAPDEEMPLMLLAHPADKELVAYYDEDIAPDLQKELAKILLEIQFPDIGPLLDLLRLRGIGFEVGHFKTYVFPARPARDAQVICFSKQDPEVKAFGFDGFAEDIYAMEEDGIIVSACVSARENDRCGEAWVYTEAAYRHRGFAQRVVNAWAGSLIQNGKVPFYSHKLENIASASLARKLGLQPVFEEIAITRI